MVQWSGPPGSILAWVCGDLGQTTTFVGLCFCVKLDNKSPHFMGPLSGLKGPFVKHSEPS